MLNTFPCDFAAHEIDWCDNISKEVYGENPMTTIDLTPWNPVVTDCETLAVGYGWDNKTRAWTQRVEYRARNRDEALNWLRFNRDWFVNGHLEEQHDAHIWHRLELMD